MQPVPSSPAVQGDGTVAEPGRVPTPAPAKETPTTAELDYAAWEALAERAEATLENPDATDGSLEGLRTELVGWRESLLAAQSTNAARIATLRQQIAALGPAPEEGQTEAEEIASRRTTLTEQLARLQAPGLAAEEAYRRADGLISEIDRALRERQTDELLQLYPSPVNPVNWPDAYRAVSGAMATILRETGQRWALPTGRETLFDNLPAILAYLLLALGLIWRGRGLVEQLVQKMTQRWSARGVRVAALGLSLGQIVLPMIGLLALSYAMLLTGLFGIVGTVVLGMLPAAGFVMFAARWLGGRVFPKTPDALPLTLTAEARTEGRLLTTLYGAVLGLDILRLSLLDHQDLSEAARAVLAYPTLIVAAVLLVRFGRLLRLSATNEGGTEDEVSFRQRALSWLGKGVVAVGIVGPVLATVGYIPAASAMIFPAATSLGVMGLLLLLQALVTDIYAAITRNEDGARNALVPVLLGFAMVIMSLPLFALIWGARMADLTELWARLREGFTLGDTKISPTAFLMFAAFFSVGVMLTRLFQGALKGSILPRTNLDQGARNALVSGVGYVGYFLAGLIAINSAGIDLSGLAIVAGALSVGIGFGMQNIVSNFVSGIILLIERPVSEGDWIEVGGVQGIVKSISVRSTRIQTFDRTDVIVPNTDLVAGQVTNWTRFNMSGRLIVPVGVAYGSDTRKVEQILRDIAEAQPLAILNPPPLVIFTGFGADSINFEIRVILRDVNFSLTVRSEINHQIYERFRAEGIEIPFAQADVTLRNVTEIADLLRALPAAVAATQPAAGASGDRGPAAPLPRDHAPGEGLDLPEQTAKEDDP
ncbi:MAG: mechanosensitive ion channel family protein [Rhodobacteraceae bacterium]|nr:mechanosensitive ion channel family protein [Paracoccaceae bacterium]